MNILKKVTGTEVYKGLNSTQKTFAITKTNLEKIKHGLTVAKNIGLIKWKAMCGFTQRNISIVEEIHTSELILEEIKENQPKKESHV